MIKSSEKSEKKRVEKKKFGAKNAKNGIKSIKKDPN